MEAHVNELVDSLDLMTMGRLTFPCSAAPSPPAAAFDFRAAKRASNRQTALGRIEAVAGAAEQVNQGLICLQSLRREPRRVLRKSEPSKVAFSSIFPVRKPLPKGV
jgi:hypothetical protein